MGKKRVTEGTADVAPAAKPAVSKRIRFSSGIFYIQATYNNTKMSVTDPKGNVLLWSTAGSIGFRGAKKGTPFASAKVAEMLADKAIEMGIKEVDVVVKGVGAGRESAIRAFSSKGIGIGGIKDSTPVPHNGPRAKKPRRV